MPGENVSERQPKIDGQRGRPQDRRPRGADFVLISPTEVEQQLSTLARRAGPFAVREGTVSDFALVYDHFDPGTEGLRESLTSTGNGYFCTRGTAEWEDATSVHYPGTYVHGGDKPGTHHPRGRPGLKEGLFKPPDLVGSPRRPQG